MLWKEVHDKNSTSYIANPQCTDWAGFSGACVELLEKFCSTIEQYYGPMEWDRFYVEEWGDSGRLIAFPGKRGKPRSAWRLSYELRCDFVLEQYDQLPNPNTSSEDFEVASLVFYSRFQSAFGKAVGNKKIKNMLNQLFEKNEFKIMVQMADDEDSATEFF